MTIRKQNFPKSVYVETSIVSYLTARPTNDLLAAAWQKITTDWWEEQSRRFSLYVSSLVIEEAGRGNLDAAARRLNALQKLPLLAITESAITLSKILIEKGAFPSKALGDALHIAVAAVHDMDYLLTWNCRHIANAEMKPVIRTLCFEHGYTCPEICTPQELMGVTNDA